MAGTERMSDRPGAVASRQRAAQSPNRLLAALPAAEYRRIEPHLRLVPLKLKTILQKAGGRMSHVYFPGSGVCSVTTVMQDGRMVEVGTVGPEGAVNHAALFAPDADQAFATIVQVPGDTAQALPIDIFTAEIDRRAGLYSRCAATPKRPSSLACRPRRATAPTMSRSDAPSGCS